MSMSLVGLQKTVCSEAEEAILLDDIARAAREEAAEAARRGMTATEWKEYLADLCQDAVDVAFQS